ncbi:hypothetical protein [Streptomyces sp. STR69]|uniref:hypothetical protein n=1 Tax=Streptomyces sp. STR69 TaxID=1796942 RepID=UPI0021C6B810|nr:hypothetical protein [Streptomyces sp. STR69]
MTTAEQVGAPAPAARPGPKWPADWDRVLDTAIRTWRGDWDTKRVQRLYIARYGEGLHRADARAFLSRRARQGVLRLHNRPNSRYYTLASSKGATS